MGLLQGPKHQKDVCHEPDQSEDDVGDEKHHIHLWKVFRVK